MIISKMSYADTMESAGQEIAKFQAGQSSLEAVKAVSDSILNSPEVLEGAITRGNYMKPAEMEIMARAIDLRVNVVTREQNALRPPLPWLDLFISRGIVRPTAISNQFQLVKTMGLAQGDISFISDMTDDLPTQAVASDTYDGVRIHPTGGSVRVGLIELRDAARNGRDRIGEDLRKKLEDHARFADSIISDGAPLKGIHGLLNNPRLLADVQTVPPSLLNPPFTEWAKKSVTEIWADLYMMQDYGRTKMLDTQYPNTLIVAELALRAITGAVANQVTGANVLNQWLAGQNGVGIRTVLGTQLFNAAAADGVSNVGLVGDFSGDNLEFYYATPEVLPTQNHGMHYHIPVISAVSDVFIKRPESITKWEGM